eukprot:TRINITY_DN1749_c0_g2_i17.p1 TRINITY_DN1749_c0_g2~~TRINITY_DN1749_c0_g2_i17.p1  ORF type:complete len:193 (-),score=21.42 TRINITY_DN1749_c0_g2_i17:16-594(-)
MTNIIRISLKAFPQLSPLSKPSLPLFLEQESESSKDSLPLQPSKEIKSKCKRPCKDNRSPRKKKKVEKTTFNIDNIVSTTSASPVLLDVGSRRTIAIPEFREVGDSFYRVEMSELVEDDSDERYEEIHKGHEIAEIFSKLSRTGEVLPPCMKDGLRVRIKLPVVNKSSPTLLSCLCNLFLRYFSSLPLLLFS